jgi:hypothetical protein
MIKETLESELSKHITHNIDIYDKKEIRPYKKVIWISIFLMLIFGIVGELFILFYTTGTARVISVIAVCLINAALIFFSIRKEKNNARNIKNDVAARTVKLYFKTTFLHDNFMKYDWNQTLAFFDKCNNLLIHLDDDLLKLTAMDMEDSCRRNSKYLVKEETLLNIENLN